MKIAIAAEASAGETRVAATPETVRALAGLGHEVTVQAQAGLRSLIDDEQYRQAGAHVEHDEGDVVRQSQVLLAVGPPSLERVCLIGSPAVIVGMLEGARPGGLLQAYGAEGMTCFAMERVPRIARAQSMDALSSQAMVAGYRAAVAAAGSLKKLLPLMMTAAGTIHPAVAVVIGAGVAGLSAIAALRRMGAVVKAVDVRPAVAQQAASLGAKFVSIDVGEQTQTAQGYARDLGEDFYLRQQEIIAPHLDKCDVLICTAQVPGRRAPLLVTGEMLRRMNPGGVVIDMAAPAGGNCQATRLGETVDVGHVTVLGPHNLATELPVHASAMYSRNLLAFLKELLRDGKADVDLGNEIIRGMLVVQAGRLVETEPPAGEQKEERT